MLAGTEGAAPGRGILGLDEAGRGSALGPLVVGGFLWTGPAPEAEERLRSVGVRDSKQLSPKERERIALVLRKLGRSATARAEPPTIDRHVDQGQLNELELSLMAGLVGALRPHEVVVDACDPDAARFGRKLSARCRAAGVAVKVSSSHRADELFAVVGAASIVAKVGRDQAVRELQARSPIPLGSGYPSDPETRRYLERCLAEKAPLPPWIRRSWKTLTRIKSGQGVSALEEYR